MSSYLILLAAALVLAAAAAQDFLFLRIANFFSLALVALFFGWVVVTGFQVNIWTNAVNFLAVLVIGAWLFHIGWLGGGDVKLLAASALWFGWPHILTMLAMVTISGGIFALSLVIGRRLIRAVARAPSSLVILRPKGPIPYGVAIALGSILALYSAGPNPPVVRTAALSPAIVAQP